MNTTEKLYEEFMSGEYSVKPASALPKYREELSEFDARLGLTAEQSEELRELILNIAADHGREMFGAGCALTNS